LTTLLIRADLVVVPIEARRRDLIMRRADVSRDADVRYGSLASFERCRHVYFTPNYGRTAATSEHATCDIFFLKDPSAPLPCLKPRSRIGRALSSF
jgi:hypothetical protein